MPARTKNVLKKPSRKTTTSRTSKGVMAKAKGGEE
jgi:hypothetical protein